MNNLDALLTLAKSALQLAATAQTKEDFDKHIEVARQLRQLAETELLQCKSQ